MPASRKLYEEIAEGFRLSRPTERAKLEQWRYDMQHVASSLKQDNMRFDRDKFVEWCEK